MDDLRLFRQGFENEHIVHLARIGHIHFLIELNAFRTLELVFLAGGCIFQITVSFFLYPPVRTEDGVNINTRAIGRAFYTGDVANTSRTGFEWRIVDGLCCEHTRQHEHHAE